MSILPLLCRGKDIFFNFRPGATGNMAVFHAAKAAMAGGTRPQVGFLGDSITMGFNAGGTGFTDAAPLRVTEYIAAACNAGGLPANTQIIWCNQGVSTFAQQLLYDTRIGAATNWGFESDVIPTGNVWRLQNPNTDTIPFTFSGIADKVTIWYIQRTANQDTMVVKDGATTIGTQSTIGGASALTSVTFNLDGRGAGKTITIARTNTVAQSLRIAAVVAWDSTIPAMDFHNWGRSGSKASVEWASTSAVWSAGNNGITTPGFHAGIYNLLTNDLAGGVATSVIKTSVQNNLTKIKVNGSPVIFIPNHGASPTYGTSEAKAAVAKAMRELALENDCPLIDESAFFGSYAAAVAKGWITDSIHPSALANSFRGPAIAKLLMAA